jgi:hypothetical protein
LLSRFNTFGTIRALLLIEAARLNMNSRSLNLLLLLISLTLFSLCFVGTQSIHPSRRLALTGSGLVALATVARRYFAAEDADL